MGADPDLLIPNDTDKWGPVVLVCRHVFAGKEARHCARPFRSVWYLACEDPECTGPKVALRAHQRIALQHANIIMSQKGLALTANVTPKGRSSHFDDEKNDWRLNTSCASNVADASKWYLPSGDQRYV